MVIIWQVVQRFSENGVGVTRQRTVNVLVELVKKGTDCAGVTRTMMHRLGNVIGFDSETRVSQQFFLVLSHFSPALEKKTLSQGTDDASVH